MRFMIVGSRNGKIVFLRHEQEKHLWTQDIEEAMVYNTSRAVADALAAKVQGVVKEAPANL